MNEFKVEVIDSHCHLDFKHFDKDRDAVIKRARDLGVIMMINSGVDYASNKKTLELAKRYDCIRATLGLSPNAIAGCSNRDIDIILDQIRDNACLAVGIGEAGLDHYRCTDASARNRQVQMFQKVIDLAHSLSLPLVIHSRDAEHEALEMVKDLDKVVFHCYGGDINTMRQAADRGFYISLATVLCRSIQHQILAKNVPLDFLLLETDSPFLAPKHGRNEPTNVLDSLKMIAKIKGISPSEVAMATARNTRNIYGIS